MGGGGWVVEISRLKLTSAKVEVEVEAELGNRNTIANHGVSVRQGQSLSIRNYWQQPLSKLV